MNRTQKSGKSFECPLFNERARRRWVAPKIEWVPRGGNPYPGGEGWNSAARVETRSAVGTVVRVQVGRVAAGVAGARGFALAGGLAVENVLELVLVHRARGAGPFGGDDARGHGDDGVAEDHGDAGDGLSQHRARDEVSVADGGDGDDGPVNPLGDAGESRLLAFDQVHEGA